MHDGSQCSTQPESIIASSRALLHHSSAPALKVQSHDCIRMNVIGCRSHDQKYATISSVHYHVAVPLFARKSFI